MFLTTKIIFWQQATMPQVLLQYAFSPLIRLTPDIEFFRDKISTLLTTGRILVSLVIRMLMYSGLIHGEGDGLPGLIVDFYNGVAVMQMHSVGFYKIRREIICILVELMKDQS